MTDLHLKLHIGTRVLLIGANSRVVDRLGQGLANGERNVSSLVADLEQFRAGRPEVRNG